MVQALERQEQLNRILVNAAQMREIEARVFEAGMPVAALMEKVGGLITRRIRVLYPPERFRRVGIVAGPGHNGGDALVVARELFFQGYEVVVRRPLEKAKDLTTAHGRYVQSIGIPVDVSLDALKDCDLLIDGLFGYGLERSLEPPISDLVHQINEGSQPILSLDLPSGLHTDTGAVLGTAVKASHTFCIGLWKLGLLQDPALAYAGTLELIDVDLPLATVQTILGTTPTVQRLTEAIALSHLPLPRPLSTHKYKVGSLLLICGSHRYGGGSLLTALGARASGVGMLYIAVPESLQLLLNGHLPEALVLSCPQTETGAIAQLPAGTDLSKFDAIACGPGLTTDAKNVVQEALASDLPLILDADGLNILAAQGTVPTLCPRQAPTILTPHPGEFKRLFPDLAEIDRLTGLRRAAEQSGAVVVLKTARTAIANPQGYVWINPESTPAIARGGSGDVLTGLVGGLVAQTASASQPVEAVIQSAVWWHAQAGRRAAQERTELGVDAHTLARFLIPALRAFLQ
jgi:NAD(P)H-hydrate epimerase